MRPTDNAAADIFSAAAAGADGVANPTVGGIGSFLSVFNGTTWDRARTALNGLNSVGTGITAAALVGQLDDTSPSSVTENQFAHIRITGARGAHANLRDNAGAELFPSPAAGADTVANPTVSGIGSFLSVFNGTTWDRARTALNTLNSTGTGIIASALVGQLDDTAPSAVTENQFAHVRITGARAEHVNLRDNAGTELGTSGNPVRTDPTGTTSQPISVADVTTSGTIASGTDTVALAIAGRNGVSVKITGTWTATLVVKYSQDGGTVYQTASIHDETGNIDATSTAANGNFGVILPTGVSHVQVSASAYTSGTATIAIRATHQNNVLAFFDANIGVYRKVDCNLTNSNLASFLANVSLATVAMKGGIISSNRYATVYLEQSGSATITNQGANTVIKSLDCGSLRRKTIFVTDSVTTPSTNITLRVQGSIDNATWRTVEDIMLSASGDTANISSRAQEILEGYRYVRVVQVTAITTGTTTAEIAAQE